MKKTLYLMRHGQTLFNARKKIQGWCDAPLTELGIKQAKIAENILKTITSFLIMLIVQLLSGRVIL